MDNRFLHCQRKGMGLSHIGVGYHYISQLSWEKQGMRESLTISTYSISINLTRESGKRIDALADPIYKLRNPETKITGIKERCLTCQRKFTKLNCTVFFENLLNKHTWNAWIVEIAFQNIFDLGDLSRTGFTLSSLV